MALVLSLAVLTGLLTAAAPATPAGAAAPIVAPGATSRPEAPDYRSDLWGDPWDFSGQSDGITIPEWFRYRYWNENGGVGPNIGGGKMSFTSKNGSWFELLQTKSYPPTADDAFSRPLNPSKYSKVSFRLRSSAPSDVLAVISYHDCFAAVNCYSARQLVVRPGWNTYDFNPNSLPVCCDGTNLHDWARPVGGLRIAPNMSGSDVNFEMDWVRIYQPVNPPVSVNVGAESVNEVWWDADADQANNANSATAGKLAGSLGANATVNFNSDAYPPGAYRFYTVKNGVKSAYSSPVTVSARPQVQVIDPDIAGGDDYATTVRGDPWDFSNPSDISSWGNTGPGEPYPSIGGGIVQANSQGSPDPGDPHLQLDTPTPIDASVYHRLSVRQNLSGPWSLALDAGGGTMGRFIWMDGTSGGDWRNSQDIVELTNQWNTITIDLHTTPRGDIEDDTSTTRHGWGVPGREWVDPFRWDPHEDFGGRLFAVDWIKLARNDRGKPNFDIKFQDKTWVSGTKADLYIDNDNKGLNGTKIADDVSVASGVNTFNFAANGIGAGTWWIYVVLEHPSGTTSANYSTGPVDMPDPYGFTDVRAGDQFFSQIRWMVQQGIASGYDDGSFRPTAAVSRQAMASFLWKYSGSPSATGGAFPDVPPGSTFYDPIRWMVQAEIASGFADGTFGPTATVSRQAMASFLYKLAGSPPQSGSSGFRDVPAGGTFSAAITWMAAQGITSGYADGTFRPTAPVSRQAAAAMLYSYAN